MAGRWIMAAPNAPTCGMNFSGPAGARTGNVSPEGGCPANFFFSRHWLLEADVLVIDDTETVPHVSPQQAAALRANPPRACP